MPQAGDTRINQGRYEVFDPSMGSNGEFVTVSTNRLEELGLKVPQNYATGPTPEGKQITQDPNTGLNVFTDIPPDPNAPPPPKTPEQIRDEQFNTQLANYVDAQGNIREDLMGGDFNFTAQQLRDLNAQGNTDQLQSALDNLKQRQTDRDIGFKGAFDDPSRATAFRTAQGTNLGNVDAYGQQTAQGQQAQMAVNPTLIQGTLDAQGYMDANQDVAQAVQRGDFASAQEHYDKFGKFEGREAPTTGGTIFKPTMQQVQPEELLNKQNYQLDPRSTFAPTQTVQNVQQATAQPKTGPANFQATQMFDQVQQQNIQAAKQTDLRDFVTAQQEQVDTQSTVQGQLASLTAQFDGGEIPSWAAPSIRLAEQRLAARGMGASTMAGEAILNAAMEAATPIAAADAQTFAAFQQANLNNRQQAEVLNSQQTLQLDIQNLNNEQQTRVFNSQQRVQALFNDQSAVNSSKQFNASSEQQNDQFFAGLFNETSKFNAQQQNAIAQFNAGQTNTMSQFNANLENQREQFNTKNSILIDQSNAVWRRQINTQNTALQNAANQMNVMNRFNMSQTALNNRWQQFRDNEFWARTTARDNDQYAKKVAYASFIYGKNADAAFSSKVGALAFDVVSGLGQEFGDDLVDGVKSFFSDGVDAVSDFDLGDFTADTGLDTVVGGDSIFNIGT
jgi:hypothetical protein